MPSSNLTDLEHYFNNSLWIMDVYGCKEQEMTSSQVGFRVLGFVWLSLVEKLDRLAGVYILYVCYIK